MARRTFDVIDLIEVYEHWWAKRSQVEISQSLGIDRKTVRKYLAPAQAAVEAGELVPGGLVQPDWRVLIEEWFPQVSDAALRQVTWPAIAAHRDYILSQLEQGVTQATIHQRLVDEHGLETSYSSLRRWVAANLPEENRRSQVRVWRPPVEPGSEAQIDYGRLGSWNDPTRPGGSRVSIWAFVMVLACSRFMFVRPVIRMDQEAWTRAHVEAFTFFDGVPARLVPDNLKTGVERPDLYDPKLNRAYAELAAHYGTLIDPARAFKPKDKPRVERAMPYVRDSYWRGREFASLAEMQDAAVSWCRDVAGQRAHRGLDGAAPAAVFAALEAPALKILPARPFVLATWTSGKIGPDIHVKVGPAIYSVPWQLAGQQVEARSTATTVQIVHAGKVVATHARISRGRATNTDHYPPEKIAFHLKTATWCRNAALDVGPACVEVVAGLLAEPALFRLRAAQGVLDLSAKHGTTRLEAACDRAIRVGDPSYRTIKGLLAAGIDEGGATAHDRRTATTAAPVAGDVPAFLRGQEALFDPSVSHAAPVVPTGMPISAVIHLPTTGEENITATSNSGIQVPAPREGGQL